MLFHSMFRNGRRCRWGRKKVLSRFGLTRESLLVMCCTERLNIQDFTFCHTLFVFFLIFISEQLATFALFNAN